MDDASVESHFNNIAVAVRRGDATSDVDAKFAMAAVCVPVMITSMARPGAVCNLTTCEFDKGREVDDLYVATVEEHKTGLQGPTKLLFNAQLLL